MKKKILLIDIDSKIQNLALKKVEKYHLDKGDEIMWNNPMFRSWADKIYVSCIFSWNREKCLEWENDLKVLIGGSGYDLMITLPPEIEAINPQINMGFTTRGCIRRCHFCIVPKKEGTIKAVGDIYNLWDKKSKEVILLDNNILALPEHFKMICNQLRKEKLKVDFNQGLDCRLLTEEFVDELKSISHHEYRFAFDDLKISSDVERAIELLKSKGINRGFWYVYCDENFESALERLLILKRLGQKAYLMRDRKVRGITKFSCLANWANYLGAMEKMDFYDFVRYYYDRDYFNKLDKKQNQPEL